MTFTGAPGILGAGGVSNYLLIRILYTCFIYYNQPFIMQSISTHLVRSRATTIPLGDVAQENNFCDPIFSIIDNKGRKNFSIQGPEEGNCWGVAKTAEFNICQHEHNKVSIVGKLHRNTRVRRYDLSNPSICKYKWLIEFPRDLDPATKACVISGAFLLVILLHSVRHCSAKISKSPSNSFGLAAGIPVLRVNVCMEICTLLPFIS
jgi:hypothetical protein